MKACFEHVSYKFGLAGGNCSQSDQTENYSSCYLVAGEQEQEQQQEQEQGQGQEQEQGQGQEQEQEHEREQDQEQEQEQEQEGKEEAGKGESQGESLCGIPYFSGMTPFSARKMLRLRDAFLSGTVAMF